MRVHRSGTTLAGAALAALALLLPLAGSAGAAQDPGALQVPARGSASMGMGVLKHDGRDGTPGGISTQAVQTEGVDVSGHQATPSRCCTFLPSSNDPYWRAARTSSRR